MTASQERSWKVLLKNMPPKQMSKHSLGARIITKFYGSDMLPGNICWFYVASGFAWVLFVPVYAFAWPVELYWLLIKKDTHSLLASMVGTLIGLFFLFLILACLFCSWHLVGMVITYYKTGSMGEVQNAGEKLFFGHIVIVCAIFGTVYGLKKLSEYFCRPIEWKD